MSELVRDLIVVAFALTLVVSLVLDGLYYAARALVLAVLSIAMGLVLGRLIKGADRGRSPQ